MYEYEAKHASNKLNLKGVLAMKIVINRGAIVSLDSLPSGSIALDGYVQGPEIDAYNRRYSFDHHAGCVRMLTKATCAQVLDAVLLNLQYDDCSVYINDVDGDTVLATWILQGGMKRAMMPHVQALVNVVGTMDAHGPAYPLTPEQSDIAHVFYKGVMAPESQARNVRRDYGTCDLRQLLDECLSNLDKWEAHHDDAAMLREVLNIPDKSEVREVEFEITHEAANFIMVKSPGFAFADCYKQGYDAIVLYGDPLPDGSIAYTVGKRSDLATRFDVTAILEALNEVEPGWGGGSTIGGAPRNADGSRSRLTPDEVFQIVLTTTL